MNQKVISFNQSQRKDLGIPELRAGDVIKVYRRIKEGAKERTQMFQGMVIALKGGQSSSPSMTIRKISSGVGVELILPLFSPQIEKIEFVKRTRARRSKLYFVRDKSVKSLSKKLKEIVLSKSVIARLEENAQAKKASEEALLVAETKEEGTEAPEVVTES
jgi:large subunit ribosomal protein L19